MNYNELILNSNYIPNQNNLNESNYDYESHFLQIFNNDNNKNEFAQESPPYLYQKNIEMNSIENSSTNVNTNNIINETSFEVIPNFNYINII